MLASVLGITITIHLPWVYHILILAAKQFACSYARASTTLPGPALMVVDSFAKIVKSEATDVMGLSIPDDMIALMQNVAYMRQIKSMSESTPGSRT